MGEFVDPRDCKHPRQELRRRVDAAGRPVYQRQCLDCGDRVGVFMAAAVALANGSQPPPFDTKFYEEAWRESERRHDDFLATIKRREEERRATEDQRNAARWERYNAYLSTDRWRAKREEVLARDSRVCQGCRRGLATQVHHLTYAHFEDELLFELMSVCDDCHARIHPGREMAR